MGVLGTVGGLLGGIFGGSGDEEAAKRVLEQLNAEAGPSSFSGIQEDPALRNDQMDTLAALKSISSGGLQTQDRVALRQSMDDANRNEAAQRGAIMQGLASRGMAGGGLDLAGQLQAQQQGATTAANAGAKAAAAASQRALQAISERGQMAGQVRGQDFNQAAARAQGQDAMAKFNAGQRVTKAGMQSGTYQHQGDNAKAMWSGFGAGLGGDLENGAAALYGKYGGGGGSNALAGASDWI